MLRNFSVDHVKFLTTLTASRSLTNQANQFKFHCRPFCRDSRGLDRGTYWRTMKALLPRGFLLLSDLTPWIRLKYISLLPLCCGASLTVTQVKINQKNSFNKTPVMEAASAGNEALVRFMVMTFGSKLCPVRDDMTNLLNLCCLSGISDATCTLVAETFPNLVKNETGGILHPTPPTFAFVQARRRIPAFFMNNRNTLHDGAAPYHV